eukprot:11412643-Ditylum_brightwellii.AAC.1
MKLLTDTSLSSFSVLKGDVGKRRKAIYESSQELLQLGKDVNIDYTVLDINKIQAKLAQASNAIRAKGCSKIRCIKFKWHHFKSAEKIYKTNV